MFNDITSVENSLNAWREFLKGKRRRKDVSLFSTYLIDNIISLHNDLVSKTYQHGKYQAFKINDPKPRDIHKATVRDRLVHHAIYRILYPYFDKKFIYDSYSCRYNKGTHRAMDRLRKFYQKLSNNNTRTVWVLKCDIRKFFASIDHDILIKVLEKHLKDSNVIWLLSEIIGSFNTEGTKAVGLPLGNLTSQLLVNIYMNEFDHFVKRDLKIKYYIRYADDFIILSDNRVDLENLLPKISDFLNSNLKLALHPKKISISTFASGIDYLGWVHFPHYRNLRTTTKRRVVKKFSNNPSEESKSSYLGLLSHGNTYKLKQELLGNPPKHPPND